MTRLAANCQRRPTLPFLWFFFSTPAHDACTHGNGTRCFATMAAMPTTTTTADSAAMRHVQAMIVQFYQRRRLRDAPDSATATQAGARATSMYLPYRSFSEAVVTNPTYVPIDDLTVYCTLCARSFKMSTKGNLRYILRHEQSLKHSDKLNKLLHGAGLTVSLPAPEAAVEALTSPTSPPGPGAPPSSPPVAAEAAELGTSMKLKKQFLDQSFAMHVESNPLFDQVDPVTVFCKACAKTIKLDRQRSPRTVLLHCESQLHLTRLNQWRLERAAQQQQEQAAQSTGDGASPRYRPIAPAPTAVSGEWSISPSVGAPQPPPPQLPRPHGRSSASLSPLLAHGPLGPTPRSPSSRAHAHHVHAQHPPLHAPSAWTSVVSPAPPPSTHYAHHYPSLPPHAGPAPPAPTGNCIVRIRCLAVRAWNAAYAPGAPAYGPSAAYPTGPYDPALAHLSAPSPPQSTRSPPAHNHGFSPRSMRYAPYLAGAARAPAATARPALAWREPQGASFSGTTPSGTASSVRSSPTGSAAAGDQGQSSKMSLQFLLS
ncbi:hypothetical protein AMAG_20284 [Allomyces macrogynus ATCC 38327]|uniref:Uncharacterized protein n=1 Tax=Allomyces macrogynus (strain ATCC 38327) TaxID=578462 RepID=A0A0L0T946_ALLM3|nr:hypothetical protein AMAG_20284 [Allomyces macrogynus ATCC 38327]|eukprot:KNE71059.1 hypothetical protein AMAG_20284 [Allomyces macrogynus ATCC 38327]